MVPDVAVMMYMNLVLINQYMHSERTLREGFLLCLKISSFVTR